MHSNGNTKQRNERMEQGKRMGARRGTDDAEQMVGVQDRDRDRVARLGD